MTPTGNLAPANGAQPADAPETYTLDTTMIKLLEDVQRDFVQYQQNVNSTLQGALLLFTRQHGLQGRWRYADNGQEIVKVTDPQPGLS